MTGDELAQLLASGEVAVLDVRTREEFAGLGGYPCDPYQGHIEGAVHLDPNEPAPSRVTTRRSGATSTSAGFPKVVASSRTVTRGSARARRRAPPRRRGRGQLPARGTSGRCAASRRDSFRKAQEAGAESRPNAFHSAIRSSVSAVSPSTSTVPSSSGS